MALIPCELKREKGNEDEQKISKLVVSILRVETPIYNVLPAKKNDIFTAFRQPFTTFTTII